MTGKNERLTRKKRKGRGSVGAARKVSPNWLQETMTCHSFNCFSIVWGQGNAPLVTSLPSSWYMALSGSEKLL